MKSTETTRGINHSQPDSFIDNYAIETEAKWHLADLGEANRLRKRLRRLGGRPIGRHNELNRLFDNAVAQYEQSGKLLRLRFINGGTGAQLTLKGQAKLDKGTKERVELELEVSDGCIMELILRELGLSVTVEYSKTRGTWQFAGTEVAFDELPFGYFCEIEGSQDAIKEVAEALGLEFDRCETRDYLTLMREHLKTRGGRY